MGVIEWGEVLTHLVAFVWGMGLMGGILRHRARRLAARREELAARRFASMRSGVTVLPAGKGRPQCPPNVRLLTAPTLQEKAFGNE